MKLRSLNGTIRNCLQIVSQLRMVPSWLTRIDTRSLLILSSRVSLGWKNVRSTATLRSLVSPTPRSSRYSSKPLKLETLAWLRTLRIQLMQSLRLSTRVRSSTVEDRSISRWEIRSYPWAQHSTSIFTQSCRVLITHLRSKLSAHWLTSLWQSLVLRTSCSLSLSKRSDPI